MLPKDLTALIVLGFVALTMALTIWSIAVFLKELRRWMEDWHDAHIGIVEDDVKQIKGELSELRHGGITKPHANSGQRIASDQITPRKNGDATW